MKIFEKKNIVKIEEADLKDAKLSSIDFADETTRKRAFINVLGARLAMKMLFSTKIEANNIYSLYTIHNVLAELDLADIYYQGIKMDVRLVFNPDEIFIPKSHFQYDLLPDLYLVINLKEDLSSAEFLGFFEPRILNKDNQNKDFYFHEQDRLNKPEELKKFLDSFIIENDFKISEEILKNPEELFLSLIDKEISKQDKIIILKQLANNFSLREKLVNFENFELLSNAINKNEGLLHDSVLDIVGTQKLFENETFVEETFSEDLLNIEVDFELIEFKPDEDSDTDDLDMLPAEIGLEAAAASATAIVNEATNTLFTEINTENELLISDDKFDLQEIQEEPKFDIQEETEFETLHQDEIGDNLPEFEVINEDESEDSLPEFEIINNDDSEENLSEFEIKNEEESEEILPEFEIMNENETEDDLPEFETLQEDELENGFTDLETLDEKLPELEDILDFDAIDDNFLIKESSEINTNKDEVMNLDDFDFNLLENSTVTAEEKVENTAVGNTNSKIDETLQKFNELEEEEENQISLEHRQIEDDEFISQIDEFISDINLSDEQKFDLENSSIFEDVENEIINPKKEDEVATNETEEEAVVEISLPEDGALELDDLINFDKDADDKDLLKFLFTEEREEAANDNISEIEFNEMPPRPASSTNKNKKMIIAASIATVVIASAVIGASVLNKPQNSKGTTKTATAISAEGQTPTNLSTEDAIGSDSSQQGMNATEGIQPQQAIPGETQQADLANRDMGKAVSDAFLSEPVNTTISKVAWEVPEDLAYNDSFRKYLQIAGKNVKLNLQNNLLLATEMAYSNKVIMDLEIGRNGDLKSSGVVISSGSKQIDKIVLQSVKETLKYLKMPASELSGQSVDATLIINF